MRAQHSEANGSPVDGCDTLKSRMYRMNLAVFGTRFRFDWKEQFMAARVSLQARVAA